jgi:hypothetical protein
MPIRSVVLGLVFTACAGRQTVWTTLPAPDLPDGGEAFVLIGYNALHLANVQHVDGHLQGHVVRAWALPRAGAVAIADDTTSTSPEEVARRAGWPELRIANARLDVPVTAVRSARAIVEPEDDEPAANDSDHEVLVAVVSSVLELVLVPACHGRC